MQLYYNFYPILYMIIIIIILFWFFGNLEYLKKIISHIKIEVGDKKISTNYDVEQEIEESRNQKEFVNEIGKLITSVDSKMISQELKDELNKKNEKNKCKECNKNELEEENGKLRYFAAYNMINADTKSILHIIYNEKYIEQEKFKSRIIQGYKKRNKKNVRLRNKDLNKIANNKYETILNGLKFLNIIEPSEDDQTIRLTREGKEFVEKYIEKE